MLKKSVIFEHFPQFSKKKSKTHLLQVKKVKKVADNKAQLERKIPYFHVFQGKKKKLLHLGSVVLVFGF